MNLLLDMTLRGSTVFLLWFALDRALGHRLHHRARRLCWAMVPFAFLFPFRFSADRGLHFPSGAETPLPSWLGLLWLAGALAWFATVWIQTFRATRRWSSLRLCTDSSLLNLLEDCKKELGITAPIGLVLTGEIGTPAVLGWLRPRILLPGALVRIPETKTLRSILLHELAHFRSADIPFNWLLTFTRALHWFNPLVHLAARRWTVFREEAADDQALRALAAEERAGYGEALLQTLRLNSPTRVPYGSVAVVESFRQLKNRMLRIAHYTPRPKRFWPSFLVLSLFSALILLQPSLAAEDDEKNRAVQTMEIWLKGIDDGHYPESWDQASVFFQKAVTSPQWVAAINSARKPLGACESRKLLSAFQQTDIPKGNGQMLKGEFVVAQFKSSFANLKEAVETVTFEKENGIWKASGYYIKPAGL